MRINKLNIENFKQFKQLNIDEFDSQFNIIIGNNGSGKTSVLEAITVGLGGYLACFNDVKTYHFYNDEIRRTVEVLGDASSNYIYHTPITVELDVNFNNRGYTWTRSKTSKKGSRSTIADPKAKIKHIVDGMILDDNSIFPVLVYQSAARMWSQKKETNKSGLDKRDISRTTGYMDCFSNASNTKLIRNWIEKMEMASWIDNKKIGEYESVKTAVSMFMDSLCDNVGGKILFDRKINEIVYQHSGERLPIDLYSAGYKSVLWSVLDIAYRMSVLNPNLKQKAHLMTPGIVLIDELDLHLHPKWQWKVIDALKETFPKVQFIVTTHSPILISSSKNDKLIVFNEDEVEYRDSAYGYEVNDVVSEFQNTTSQAKGFKDKLDVFSDLLEDGKLEEAKVLLAKLTNELSENHPEIAKAKVSLEFEEIGLVEID